MVSWSVCLAYASLLTDTFLPGWNFFEFRGNGWEKYQEVQSGNSLPKSRGGRRHSTPYIAIRCRIDAWIRNNRKENSISSTTIPSCSVKYTKNLKHLRDIVPTSPFHIFKSKSNLIYRDRQLLQDGILMKISKQISCVIRSIQFQSKLFDLYDLISLIPSQAYACWRRKKKQQKR